MIGETTDVGRVTDLFYPLSLNVVVYAHLNVGVFTRTPFLPYPVCWCNLTLQRMDGATVDAWLYFPGINHKGRTKLISILPFGQFWVALIINRYVVTEYVYS